MTSIIFISTIMLIDVIYSADNGVGSYPVRESISIDVLCEFFLLFNMMMMTIIKETLLVHWEKYVTPLLRQNLCRSSWSSHRETVGPRGWGGRSHPCLQGLLQPLGQGNTTLWSSGRWTCPQVIFLLFCKSPLSVDWSSISLSWSIRLSSVVQGLIIISLSLPSSLPLSLSASSPASALLPALSSASSPSSLLLSFMPSSSS